MPIIRRRGGEQEARRRARGGVDRARPDSAPPSGLERVGAEPPEPQGWWDQWQQDRPPGGPRYPWGPGGNSQREGVPDNYADFYGGERGEQRGRGDAWLGVKFGPGGPLDPNRSRTPGDEIPMGYTGKRGDAYYPAPEWYYENMPSGFSTPEGTEERPDWWVEREKQAGRYKGPPPMSQSTWIRKHGWPNGPGDMTGVPSPKQLGSDTPPGQWGTPGWQDYQRQQQAAPTGTTQQVGPFGTPQGLQRPRPGPAGAPPTPFGGYGATQQGLMNMAFAGMQGGPTATKEFGGRTIKKNKAGALVDITDPANRQRLTTVGGKWLEPPVKRKPAKK